jgi:hypothetical protein
MRAEKSFIGSVFSCFFLHVWQKVDKNLFLRLPVRFGIAIAKLKRFFFWLKKKKKLGCFAKQRYVLR